MRVNRKIPLRWFSRLRADRRGNVAMIVAAVFPLLIGAAGLAVDGIEWTMQKRDLPGAS